MVRRLVLLLTLTLSAGSLLIGAQAMPGSAQDVGTEARRGPNRAASYINPDIGLPTFNPDVEPTSECATPDQRDRQVVSPMGSTTKNVHNDACLFDRGERFDGKVSFVESGPGIFSACPDPDGAGPKTAAIKNKGSRCYQTGWQDSNGERDGDTEYHARVNNTGKSGLQTVTFCHDPQDNGCDDATVKDTIVVRWVADAGMAP